MRTIALAFVAILALAGTVDADTVLLQLDHLVFNYPGTPLDPTCACPATAPMRLEVSGSTRWDNDLRQEVPGAADFSTAWTNAGGTFIDYFDKSTAQTTPAPAQYYGLGSGEVVDLAWRSRGNQFTGFLVFFRLTDGRLEPGDYPIGDGRFLCEDSGCRFIVHPESGTQSVHAIPEPATLALVGAGLTWTVWIRRRHRN